MPSTKTAYHHGDLHRALLSGALELLAEGGTDALTMRAVAERVGVSSAAPYRHFTDKRDMLAALAEEGFADLERACAEACAAAPNDTAPNDTVAAFARQGEAYVRFAIAHPARYRVMFGPEIPDKRAYAALHRSSMAAYDALRSALRACAAAGLFEAEEIEIRAMRSWSLVHGMASLFIDGQLNVDDVIGREMFLGRVGAVLRLEGLHREK